MRICEVDGCDRPYRCKGMCDMHYRRQRRLGSTDLPEHDDPDWRVWEKVEPTGFCWLWTGATDAFGYGVGVEGGWYSAHRRIYTILVGPIPDGLTLDHLCRITRCVNPDHLEPVTNGENSSRRPGKWTLRTTCLAGLHDITLPGAVKETKSGRTCRECSRDYHRKYNQTHKRRDRSKP